VGFAAEDFSTPPSRAYHLRGKKIRIPDNYFTREELGTYQAGYTRNTTTGVLETTYQPWTGGFRQELVYTNNPAWVFYDILTNVEYGLGDFIQDTDIDIYEEQSLSKLIINLKTLYEDEWKELNLINTSIKLPLTISLSSKEMI